MAPLQCTGCDFGTLVSSSHFTHPLLKTPLCEPCYDRVKTLLSSRSARRTHCMWCSNETSVDDGISCQVCYSVTCTSCITRNFGACETDRILDIRKHWTCYNCNPEPLVDFSVARGFALDAKEVLSTLPPRFRRRQEAIVIQDLSLGKERIPITCFNDINCELPNDFCYITEYIPAVGSNIATRNPEFLSCCSCTDNCRDPRKCECAQLMKNRFAYDENGILVCEHAAGIYECNFRCPCHKKLCKNRVVGGGSRFSLEVFRCSDAKKGWGVRSLEDIPLGSYVTCYLGELLTESECEERGLGLGDEYLFTLDAWGHSRAYERLDDLSLKVPASRIESVDVTAMSLEQLSEVLGSDIARKLHKANRLYPKDLPDDVVERKRKRSKLHRDACTVLSDRVLIETETKHSTFVIDAK